MSSGTLTNPLEPPGSSSIGPPSVEAFQPSLLYVSSSSPSGLLSNITGRPTKKPDEPNFTSFYSSPQDTTETMITTRRTLHPTPAPLPGIRACRPLSPSQFPFANEGTRGTQVSLPGNSSSINCCVNNSLSPLVSHPASPPAFPHQSQPCTSLPTGPVSGRSRELPPGQGCHMLTSMSTRAANLALLPLPSQLPEHLQQNSPSPSLNPGEWPTLPIPSRPSWSGWTKLLRSNYPVNRRQIQ